MKGTDMPVTVAIVEDFPIVRTAISEALDRDSRIEVVDVCADAKALLDAVADGGTGLAPQVALAVLDPRAASSEDTIGAGAARLEPTDAEIVRMVVGGETDEQIAKTLFVSTRTVQNRLTRIRRMAHVQ